MTKPGQFCFRLTGNTERNREKADSFMNLPLLCCFYTLFYGHFLFFTDNFITNIVC